MSIDISQNNLLDDMVNIKNHKISQCQYHYEQMQVKNVMKKYE